MILKYQAKDKKKIQRRGLIEKEKDQFEKEFDFKVKTYIMVCINLIPKLFSTMEKRVKKLN